MAQSPENHISGYSRAGKKADRRFSRHERENRFLVKRSEDFQVMGNVFDLPTLLAIQDLIDNGTLVSMKSHFASEKESKVYIASAGDDAQAAVKIFLTVSVEFKKRMPYMAGDPSFDVKRGSTRNPISARSKKEFRNLQVACKQGASVPAPISVRKNVLVMELISNSDGQPAPTLVNCEVTRDDINKFFEKRGITTVDSVLTLKNVEGGLPE